MSQTNIREGYRIMTLEVIKLIEDLISYVRQYSAKVKTEDLSNTPTLILSETAQRQSSSVMSNRSTALITDKFGVASLTKPAILNNANVALVDAVHYSVVKQFPMFRLITKESQQKLEENYFKVIDALTMTLIEDDDDLLGTVNSYIKLRRLRARRKTKAADSRHAKASRGRTKKDKDLEDSNTSSNVPRSRRRDRAAARARSAKRKHPLDSDDYRLDSSSDINPKDDLEDEEATTAKDLAREQKERLKALLNAKTRDSLSARVETAIEHCTLEEIFANAIGMGKTRAITEVQNAQAEGDAIEHNAVDDDDKLYPTKGERTFYCACERSLSFNAEPRQAAIIMTALQFCFFSNSPLENIGRLTKEEAIEMQIDTTDAISKALAAANKLVAPQSYIIPEANTPAVHSKATKHCLAPLAAQFVIVCSFRKVDKHVFKAYNTISVTAQRTIIRKGGPYIEKRAILLPDSVTSDRIYKIEDARNIIANIKHDASEHESSYNCLCLDFLSIVQNAKQQCRDILEKEGLNKLEASRRVIFNCFEMQAIASYPALATLKAAHVKDLFTNLSKDYFLVREARAITKSSLNIAAEDAAKAANTPPPPKEVCAKILIELYKLIMQARDLDRPWIIVALMAFIEAITLTEATHVLAEMCISIVYFNSDSELELKVLGKQDVKITS
ncbi:hypothetical protein HBI88_198960 [Parastagonospora nodorum]|nr:hypothetical protein HBI94_193230 [Parastagonospora nodorum]KAH5815169.1 hypothetical protein HBI93_203620 [Parastagonospora nodorum]KAH5844588.1 hypothetical protein HBI90_253550 [Parastagonospora nodorum]KAH5847130.1 hypothetical protein HBI91_212630 [Parastagonospora nodorum]KAH5907781.1 hypothetical protein HBI88_198960 [Parastagonospora nodorum]